MHIQGGEMFMTKMSITAMFSRLGLISLLTLGGCGAETVGTAAVAAKAKQQEAAEAQKLKESVVQQIDTAQALEQQRLKDATGDAAGR
jgi:hypothetical protein